MTLWGLCVSRKQKTPGPAPLLLVHEEAHCPGPLAFHQFLLWAEVLQGQSFLFLLSLTA